MGLYTVEYCDNAAMIAISGYYKFQDEQFANSSVSANARMKLCTLQVFMFGITLNFII